MLVTIFTWLNAAALQLVFKVFEIFAPTGLFKLIKHYNVYSQYVNGNILEHDMIIGTCLVLKLY